VLVAVFRKALGEIRMREQKANLVSRPFHRMDQHSGNLVDSPARESPTAEAMTGVFFHNASETVKPKPSRKDF